MVSTDTEHNVRSLETLIEQYRANESLYSEDINEYRRRKLRIETSLNVAYRDLVLQVLDARVRADHNVDANGDFVLRFSPEDLEILTARFRNVERSDDTTRLSEGVDGAVSRRYPVLSFPELLQELYRVACRVPQLRERETTVSELDEEARALRVTMRRLKEDRAKLAPILVDSAHHDRFETLCARLDEQRDSTARHEHQRKRAGLRSKDEITELILETEKRSGILGELQSLVNAPHRSQHPRARELFDTIDTGLARAAARTVELEFLLDQARSRERSCKAEIRAMTQTEIVARVFEEVGFVFDSSEYAAQLGKASKVYVFSTTQEVVTEDRLQGTLARIEEYHPDVFENLRSKRVGRPLVCLVPGCGVGVCDYMNNRLLVPWTYPRSLLDSLASAVIMYLKDVQAHSYDPGKKLLETYKTEISREQRLRSFAKVHRSLLKDYVKWVERGVEGMGVFDKGTRLWFETYIAPNKNSIKAPLELKVLTLADNRKLLSQLQKEPTLDLEGRFVVATLWALQEKWDAAIPFYQEVLSMDIQHRYADAAFNLGIIARKQGHLDEAGRHFGEYVARAQPSWWTRKAQEHQRAVLER